MTATIHELRGSAPHDAELPLPISFDTEQAVLGTLLMNNHALASISPHIAVEDFFEPLHGAIFDVASTLIGEGKAATPATLAPFLGGARYR